MMPERLRAALADEKCGPRILPYFTATAVVRAILRLE
jgi:hypothetical protein